MFLQTSEADLVRGAVEAIRCRLCPKAQFKNFEEFKRHSTLPPRECRRVIPAGAAEKRQRTKEAHEDFVLRMRHALRAGEGIPEDSLK
jgi:hypothetical protein